LTHTLKKKKQKIKKNCEKKKKKKKKKKNHKYSILYFLDSHLVIILYIPKASFTVSFHLSHLNFSNIENKLHASFVKAGLFE
jgi:anaerobic C4-dicarboxylate transporter